MRVYRLAKTRFAKDLTGEGARLFGGRWNNVFTPCLYTSESRALAILEYTVNANIEDIPRALSLCIIEIPETNIITILPEDLPGNWKDAPAPASTKNLGTKLLNEGNYNAIKIPSCIIEAEYNYLLNPLHPDNKHIKLLDVKDFIYDIRIKNSFSNN